MKNILKNYKKIVKYFFIFCFFLFWNLFLQDLTVDEIWNYGFIYNIFNGSIPYRDFNMVLPCFYQVFMSFFLLLFGNNIIIVHFINSIILTFSLFLVEKLGGYVFSVIFLMIFFGSVVFPSYNLFLLILLILIIFLEKNYNNKDLLIGLIVGLVIITKHSVGFFVALVSLLYYFKDKNKIKKRLIGIFIPSIIFLMYLFITGSFLQFLDLCVYGLFDFADKNSFKYINIFFISLIILVLNIILIFKNKKNIDFYYLLSFFSIVIPLFDLYHFKLYLTLFLILLSINNKIKIKYFNFELFFLGLIIGISFLSYDSEMIIIHNIKHFKYRSISKVFYDNYKLTNYHYNNLGKNNVIILGPDSYLYKISNDMKIGYIDLINYGNWGYNGSSKIINYINNNKDKYFFIDTFEFGKYKQTDQQALNYIKNNFKCIDKFGKYEVFYGKFR